MIDSPIRQLTQFICAAFPLDGQVATPQVSAEEWVALERTAQEHRLTSLVYAALVRNDDAVQPPPAILAKFEFAYHNTQVTNWLAFRELGILLGELKRAQIPIILLKGAALANTVYPNISVRPMGDIDFLILRDDVSRLDEILTVRDFSRALEPTGDFYARFSYDQAYERGGEYSMVLEAHWHLWSLPYYRNRIPIEWFWQRTMPMSVNGQSTYVFAPEAQILHLASHAVLHHQGHHLLAAYDLALVLNRFRTRINWDEVLAAAHTFGFSRILQSMLAYTEDAWGVAVSAEAAAELARSVTVSERILFALNTSARVEARDLWDGMNQPDSKLKLLYFWHTLLPSRAYMQERYKIGDPHLLTLYYLQRLGRGAGMFVRSAAAIFRNILIEIGRKQKRAS